MPMKSLLHSMLHCLHLPENEHMYSRLHVILTVDSACFNCEEQIIMSSRPKRNDMQKLLCSCTVSHMPAKRRALLQRYFFLLRFFVL